MLVSLGILAHNEATNIAALIGDIGRQTILSNENCFVEIHVVANGCTDTTVSVSTDALADHVFHRKNVSVFVHSLPSAGKSYAWNEFVHDLLSTSTNFVFFLDADIRIPYESTLQLMLEALIRNETACISVDKAVKDLSLSSKTTLIERLILAASGTAHDTRNAITGQLYCARFADIQDICMPIGLPVEDGFLCAMILTYNLTLPVNFSRLVFVDGAWHIFKSRRRIGDVFHHNVRLVIGTIINRLLYEHFRNKLVNTNIKNYVAARNRGDPYWINGLIAAELRQKKYFITHASFIGARVRWLLRLSVSEQIKRAPIIILASLFDLGVIIYANHLMRQGAGSGFW